MKRERLEELVQLLPESLANEPGLAQHNAVALNDPGFGHSFLKAFLDGGETLPPAVHESWLRQAYAYYSRGNPVADRTMIQVEQLTLPTSTFLRQVLHALLVSRDATMAQISEWLALEVPVVRMYEQLHFNVRDRFDERAYLAQIVYPHGRIELLKTDAAEELTTAQALLQAGWTHGAGEVLNLAGMNHQPNDQPSVEQSLKEFEEALLSNAVQLARVGRLNSKCAPGINHARNILTARRKMEPSNSTMPANQGLFAGIDLKPGDITPGDAIRMTLQGICSDEEFARKLHLYQEEIPEIRPS